MQRRQLSIKEIIEGQGTASNMVPLFQTSNWKLYKGPNMTSVKHLKQESQYDDGDITQNK